MGDIQDNKGNGRVLEGPDANGVSRWRIQAWCGRGSTPDHTCLDLGDASSSTDRATWSAACAVAHTSGRTAWESHMSSTYAGWSTWYGGLSASRQAGQYEAARLVGQYGLDP